MKPELFVRLFHDFNFPAQNEFVSLFISKMHYIKFAHSYCTFKGLIAITKLTLQTAFLI